MNMPSMPSSAFPDTKPHYKLLDGLRGVAAILVLWYHIHEGFAFAGSVNGVGDGLVKTFNHGYLAVDFFFMLSGFVIGYAYDGRWSKGFTMKDFFRRRLIRLHPMVVMGAAVGAAAFLLQGSVRWDGTHIATSAVMLALFSVPSLGVRGGICVNGIFEMFCVILVFPALVWLGASGGRKGSKACKLLGDISFPLYIVHYPVMYLFYSRLIKTEKYSLSETWPVALGVMAVCLVLAFLCLKLYDEPVRGRLSGMRKR